MKLKLFVIVIFSLIFLLGNVSALEWDNKVDYKDNDKTVIITNWLGLGEKLGEATLTSHETPTEIRNVIPGKDRAVMYYDFKDWELYEGGLGDVKFINVKNGKIIDKPYYFATPIYQEVNGSYNHKICEYDISGKPTTCYNETYIPWTDKQIIGWKKLDNTDIPKGNITIGLITDVETGDYIDGVWTIAGKEVKKHAAWTDALRTGLVHYYNMSTDSNDTFGISNFTDNDGAVITANCQIGECYQYDGVSADLTIDPAADIVLGQEFTFNSWMNSTPQSATIGMILSQTQFYWEARVDGFATPNGEFHITYDFDHGGGVNEFGSGVEIDNGTMFMVTWTREGDSNLSRLYVNGVNYANQTIAGDFESTDGFFGARSGSSDFLNGQVDDTGIWNRSLTPSEVAQLYTVDEELTPKTGPVISLIIPLDNTNSPSSNLIFNCSATDNTAVLNLTLFINDASNITLFNTTSNQIILELFENLSFVDGDYNWTCDAYDDLNEQGTTLLRDFTIDTIFPVLDVTSPTGDQGTFVSGRNLSLEWTVTDININDCFYDYGGANTSIPCPQNQTNFTVTDSSLTSLKFYANDSANNLKNQIITWSYSFEEVNVTFNANVSETSSQEFIINLETSLEVLSIFSFLSYAGQNHTSMASCIASNCTLSNRIDVPLVTTGTSDLNPFFWNITIFNGTGSTNIATSTRNQNVSIIQLDQCNPTLTNKTLNFTTFDEQTLIRIDPYRFDATFDFWLGGGSVKQNISIANSTAGEIDLCLSPSGTYFLDGQIDYNDVVNSSYNTRNYYFQNDTIDNQTLQHIPLYLLNSSKSTTFILKVQDDNLLQLPDHLILIQRFSPGNNTFNTVQIAKTDDNGQTLGFFETEVVDYRFIIKFQGTTLLTTSQQKIFGESVPFTLTFTIGEDLGAPWETLNNVSDVTFTLDYDKTSRVVTYTYVDTSGDFTLGRLIVEKQNFSLSTNDIVCNINSTLTSATLLCNVGIETGNASGTYTARGIVNRGSDSFLLQQISFIIESFSEAAGLLGVLLGWFIILIAAFAFKFNEIAGIFMINAAIIFVNLIGLVSFGLVAISAIMAVSIMIVVVLER